MSKTFKEIQSLLMTKALNREISIEHFMFNAQEECLLKEFKKALEMRKIGKNPIFLMDGQSVFLCEEKD